MKTAVAVIYLDPRPLKDGTNTVKLRVTYNRSRRFYATDIKLNPLTKSEIESGEYKDALEKFMNIQRHTAEQTAQKKKLNRYLAKAEKCIDSLKVFTFDLFEEAYFENRDASKSVSLAFEKKIDELRLNDQIGTAVTYECAFNSLNEFKNNLEFADITPAFLKGYETKMKKEGKSDTTIGMYLRNLRALYNIQKIDKSLYPFGKGKYEIPTGRNIKKALTLEEIARIYNYEAKPNTTKEMAKDYWLFMYLCNGMNVKDLCLLKWENINGNTLRYIRAKTKATTKSAKPIQVALKDETLAIIKEYGQPAINKNAFIFPHLKAEMTAERQREVYQQLTKNINKYIKQIAKEVGINKEVTTYYARHSFATVLKRSGANISMISDLLGHSSLSVTESYLDGFEMEQIQQQTDVLTTGFNKIAN